MRLMEWFNLKPGMKIAIAVWSRDRLVLAAGSALTAAAIARLPIWGIHAVPVYVATEDRH